ncbi:MAG: hypothetical protein A07HR60_02029 [uncultured archaeon A07HR60]|jgi:hypothetical protein|nr:MAG: hypothetical protein J07HR59_01461 [Halorubrum sp. J07HR59]ESS10886.1 MAG: hypothetical protein A07HR60_02029 [uncultured archaeon A07HR60]
MVNPRQGVSPTGIRVLGAFVLTYLLVGSYMHFYMSLPVTVYAAYGIFSWAAGMGLFYWLHKNYMSQLG